MTKPTERVDPGLAATVDGSQKSSRGAVTGSSRGSVERAADLSRFMIIEELGAGGMGVVLSAYDPELDRKLAIKVLRSDRWEQDETGEGRRRLLREAQAMGRLSHPNVITVFEVGQSDDDVFIAMEHVDGGTLEAWLGTRRDWRDIVAMFSQAGRGLAAAHAAGIVHRDFKPDNVLIGSDGRARVTDFGLAGLSASEVPPDEDPELLPIPHLDASLTRVGAILGTPRYMAPEQHERGDVDDRADQFAFCVALYRALYGRFPFEAEEYRSLRAAVLRGDVDLPASADVPRHLVRVLARGLAVRPADRYDSMDALLAELGYDPRQRRRRLLVGAGVAALVGLAAYGFTRSKPGATVSCSLPDDVLAGIWDDDVKTSVAGNFRRTKGPFIMESLTRVNSLVDGYVARWKRMRVDACKATHRRGEQSQAMLDLRMTCLDQRLGEVKSLTSLLARSSKSAVVARSVDAAFALTPVARCADRKALMSAIPPPKNAQIRGRVSALRKRIVDVDTLRKAFQLERALADARSVEQATRSVDYPPLRAEALFLLGRLQSRAGKPEAAETLRAASGLAAEANHKSVVSNASLELIRVRSHLQAKYAEALAMSEVVGPALTRTSNDPILRAQLLIHIGTSHRKLANYTKAKTELERALVMIKNSVGDKHPLYIQALHNLGNVYYTQKRYTDAGKQFQRELELIQTAFGKHHARTSGPLQAIAVLRHVSGDIAGASELFRQVLKVREASLGPEHPRVASSLNNLGVSLLKLKRYSEARKHLTRAARVWTKALGDKHPNTASPMINLGKLSLATDDRAEAERWFRKALAVLSAAYPNGHPRLTRLRKRMTAAKMK